MSKKRRELSEDERKLWRRVASSVKARREAAPGREADPGPTTSGRKSATLESSMPASERKIVAPRPATAPADRGAEKRVRRGQVAIDATLDLHGYKQDAAYSALALFLQQAQARGGRAVLVVTGVGRAGDGVLKKRLPDWLAAGELKPVVSGYAQAHRAHGGAGAFYVFLRRAR